MASSRRSWTLEGCSEVSAAPADTDAAATDLRRLLAEALHGKAEAERRADEHLAQIQELEGEVARLKAQLALAGDLDRSPAVSSGWRGWLQQLSCPPRGRREEPLQQVCAQEACWQLLINMKGVTALLCSVDDFTILEASKEACKIWGCTALYGQSVLTLLNGSTSASWFAKTLEQIRPSPGAHHASAAGIVIKDLASEEFVTNSGVIDSPVLLILLPPEPQLSQPGALLVILTSKLKKKMSTMNEQKPERSSSARKLGNDGPTVEAGTSSAKDVVEALSDLVIHLTADLQVCAPSQARDLSRQEALVGWVLSGQSFTSVVDPAGFKRFLEARVRASETKQPQFIRADVMHMLGPQPVVLVVVDTGGFHLMVGIKLEGEGPATWPQVDCASLGTPDSGDDGLLQAGALEAGKILKDVFLAPSAVSDNSGHLHSVVASAAPTGDDPCFAGGQWRVIRAVGLGIGDFTHVQTIGIGGQGTVFHVKDPAGCSYALKRINLPGRMWHRDFPLHLRGADREARVLKSLAWASAVIVRVHDCWIQDDFKYACIVMEWVPKPLSTVLKDQRKTGTPVPLQDTIRWLTHIATGLGIVHAAGFMHRDIKPANILLTDDLRWCKIADLGLGRALHEAPVPRDDATSQVSTSLEVKSVLSGYTEHTGTNGYMSPEAAAGGQYNMLTDIYSLGCVLFELLTSRALHENQVGDPLAGVGADATTQKDNEAYCDLRGLCSEMLKPNPDDRPVANALLQRRLLHPAIRDLLAHHPEPQLGAFFASACPGVSFGLEAQIVASLNSPETQNM